MIINQMDIPTHWPAKRARFVFREGKEKAHQCDIQLTASQGYGVISQQRYQELSGNRVTAAIAGTENFQHVRQGDFIISLRTFEGGIEYAYETGCISPAYTILRPIIEINSGFYRYFLKSSAFLAMLQTVVTGIRDGKSVKYKDFANILLPTPNRNTQKRIADFLDRETACIDELINKKLSFLELLDEKRVATISNAVTKGIDPNVSLKDSGLFWIGQVPEHWGLSKIKYVKSKSKNAFVDGPFGSNLKSIHHVSNGDVFIIESEFATRGMLSTKDLKTITSDHFQTIQRSSTVAGDIIIAKIGAYFGLSNILPELPKPAVVSGNSMKLTVDSETHFTPFVHYALLHLKWSGAMDVVVGTTAQPALSLQTMNNLHIAFPDKNEQQVIANFLDCEITRIDTVRGKIIRSLETLKELRSAIITAAVTGQIDVDKRSKSGGTERCLDALEEEMHV